VAAAALHERLEHGAVHRRSSPCSTRRAQAGRPVQALSGDALARQPAILSLAHCWPTSRKSKSELEVAGRDRQLVRPLRESLNKVDDRILG
jgi:hypothetical protein